ncbi:hypothetical protein D0Y65_011594 [Glycine soja]|uniref:Uncharacterized protein n=1 Tax=Glycine soja TaxID=3848 RepID=A0A445KKZ1_GLYSO|nr:hypothetical protein D0Y65_011594 [Glycine soja]RZC11472.1 hypothetical protein D0Y65_011594 [Glycine soja]RZC11473.1 hypothetical protein D0Y65_011594 [Glycine soja]RZC11474.1 hypothetical protein D0Y65_011594 [Glycine soja]RZC11475.1 hypothetical protein D0Y65_011594 [Glycine soja]
MNSASFQGLENQKTSENFWYKEEEVQRDSRLVKDCNEVIGKATLIVENVHLHLLPSMNPGRTQKACLVHPKRGISPGSSLRGASRETQMPAKPSNIKSVKIKNAIKPFDKLTRMMTFMKYVIVSSNKMINLFIFNLDTV